jgi:3-mercaptopyruvate sulfurtransferase SseA
VFLDGRDGLRGDLVGDVVDNVPLNGGVRGPNNLQIVNHKSPQRYRSVSTTLSHSPCTEGQDADVVRISKERTITDTSTIRAREHVTGYEGTSRTAPTTIVTCNTGRVAHKNWLTLRTAEHSSGPILRSKHAT